MIFNKITLLFFILAIGFGGCSSKEINDTSSEIGNDIGEFTDKIFKQRKG